MVRLLQSGKNFPRHKYLEVSIPQWCDCCRASFHHLPIAIRVSIPQWCDCCLIEFVNRQTRDDGFQSHNGAIAARRTKLFWRSLPAVSIPQWCDCCNSSSCVSICSFVVSIPQWCDCCVSAMK